MNVKLFLAILVGLTVQTSSIAFPALAQQQVTPTPTQGEDISIPTQQEVTPTPTQEEDTSIPNQEDDTPSYDQGEDTSIPDQEYDQGEDTSISDQEDDTPSYDQGEDTSIPDQEEPTLTLNRMRVQQAFAETDYSRLESKPSSSSINPGATSPSARYMKSVLGVPGALTEECSAVTNSRLKQLLVTEDVGPFKVTGLKPAVAAVKKVFTSVKQKNPQLYSQLGTAGMLCVRKVRGGSNFSNHSWGTAIDIKINGKLDKRGDNKTQVGLKALYPYFQNEGFYWGAEFPTEDSMHFEASKELIEKWKRQGSI